MEYITVKDQIVSHELLYQTGDIRSRDRLELHVIHDTNTLNNSTTTTYSVYRGVRCIAKDIVTYAKAAYIINGEIDKLNPDET